MSKLSTITKRVSGVISILILAGLLLSTSSNAMVYNMTNITNANNIYDMFGAMNNTLDNMIGYGILLMSFVITFVVSMGVSNNVVGAFTQASFFCAVSGLFLVAIGFIPSHFYVTVVVLLALSFFVNIFAGVSAP